MAEDFEKHRKDLLDQIQHLRRQHPNTDDEKGRIVVFGADSAFVEGLIQVVEKKYRTRFLGNPDEACSYCLTHETKVVIMEMDPPTDWKMATDVFSNVRTIRPQVKFILCTKNPSAVSVQTLAAQHAAVLAIPFSSDVLFREIKGGLQDRL